MKKLLFTAVSALAMAGVAVAAESTQFGVLRVPSTERKTIVAVPWLETGTGSDPVQDAVVVSNLVLTSELEAGDMLKYYNGNGYECWRLDEGAGNVKYWQSVQMDNDKDGVYEPTTSPSKRTIGRGKAIILDRCGGVASRDRSGGFCIMGKPAAQSGVEIALAGGENVYSLIAPPNVASDTNVNTDMTWEGVAKTDQLTITLGNGKSKTYSRKKMSKDSNDYNWVDQNTGSIPEGGIKIPKGQGAWFKSTTAGAKTASWGMPNS